jgi:hypothetical protein
VERSCERGNKPSGSIKFSEILERLSNWRLLKKDSASDRQVDREIER